MLCRPLSALGWESVSEVSTKDKHANFCGSTASTLENLLVV